VSSSDTSACVGSFKVIVDKVGTNNETLVLLDFADLATFAEWANSRTALGETVTGLGDAAFLGPKKADPYTMLCLRSGDRALRVAWGTSGQDIGPEKLRAIAEMIVARMQ